MAIHHLQSALEDNMAKSHFNSMITGNSSMLGCLDDRGELIRLFWPHIDFPQHIGRLIAGITCPEVRQGTSWLNSEEWRTEQTYQEDTNIAVTSYTNENSGLLVRQSDFALPDKDVFIRHYEIVNNSANAINTGFTAYSSSISTTPDMAGILFEQNLSALIHFKNGYYYSVSSHTKAGAYELGGNALNHAGQGQLKGSESIGMMNEGALLWEPRMIAAGGKICFALYICMSHGLKTLKMLTREIIHCDPCEELERTAVYWRNYIHSARRISTGITTIDTLYKRSLLVIALMADKNTGALLAAPEIDEEFARCGRYAYCWGRDAAFITTALDKCGLSRNAGDFYRWAAGVQDEEGSWQQRYQMDGNLAPSWGLQVDEGGSIIWGILKHYIMSGDKAFLAEMWPSVKRGTDFLLNYMDHETGLPWLSFDLWEERLGEHAYSTAAVCAGMEAGAKIAEILCAERTCSAVSMAGEAAGTREAESAGELTAESTEMGLAADTGELTEAGGAAEAGPTAEAGGTAKTGLAAEAAGEAAEVGPEGLQQLAEVWREAAGRLREALQANFWKSELNRFARSVRVKLNGWGEEPTDAKVWLKMNDRSIVRDYSLLDRTADISLLGLCYPFGIYPPDDPRMEATAQAVEQALAGSPAGGLLRYEGDSYIGGNPWIIATLWAALFHIEKKSYVKAHEYLDWAIKGTTDQGLLPEQIDKGNGKPAWVIPLTWSHAMFILVLDALIEAGEL